MTEYERLRAQAEETDARQQERTHEVITAELERLRKEIADYEQTDLVPRSRYDAVNADWLEAREQTKQLAHRAGKEIESLQSQLEQLREELAEEKRLRAELKQIAQTGISEVSSVGTAMKEIAVTDFRVSVVELCKQRASEYDQYARGYEPSDRMRLCLSAKRDALKAFASELEQL